MKSRVAVIGGGLAGCEAACFLARQGQSVDLFEMKPKRFSPAHKMEDLGELVCSNSLGSQAPESAPGMLKGEMRALGSVVLQAADSAKVPAGRALGVDREMFAKALSEEVHRWDDIHVIREECTEIPSEYDLVIVATGPLTSDGLAQDLAQRLGQETLYFYDSISPIVAADSIDMGKTYFGSRYEPESDDYLNCPLDRTTYENFVQAILQAEKVPVRSFEAMRCFESCLPIEVLAERGPKTLAFGPMKPVGLEDPRTGKRPHAVLQLRRENDPTTLYNLVGFQTRMKWGEQKRVFRMIPGLEDAEFVRMGSMHRNTYLDSPKVLRVDLSLKSDARILVAGQLTGVEGYMESASMGLWAGMVALGRLTKSKEVFAPPPTTAMGGLLKAITETPLHGAFAPMNVNFGLLPPDENRQGGKKARRARVAKHAKAEAEIWRKEVAQEFEMSFPILPEEEEEDPSRYVRY